MNKYQVFLLPLTFGHLNPVQPGCSMGKPTASKNWRHNLASGWPLSSNFTWTVAPCCSPSAVNLHLCMVYIGLEWIYPGFLEGVFTPQKIWVQSHSSHLPKSPPTRPATRPALPERPKSAPPGCCPGWCSGSPGGTRIYGALTLW